MNVELKEYSYLWNSLDQGWVLVKAPDLRGGFCVFNKNTSTMLCIENDAVNEAVCKRMKDAGCEVLERIPRTTVSVTPLPQSKRR